MWGEGEKLADGWEWRGPSKVKKGRKHYIRVSGTNFKYVCSRVRRGDYDIMCEGGYPHLKLPILTYYEDELNHLINNYGRTETLKF